MKIELRPHHALCMQFFEGKGYSEAFTKHMYELLAFPKETEVMITTSFDEVCKACPNHPDARCLSEEKVTQYDQRVMELCGFTGGQQMTLEEFWANARENIIDCGKLSYVCHGCGFLNICNKTEKEDV